MYEPEVNNRFESANTLPSAVAKRLGELESQIKFRTILPWGEHCTECVWPTCYTTCELYDPRVDGNCRLFVDGMVRIDVDASVRPYLLKLRFKRWGKLWAVGNLAGYSPQGSWLKEKTEIVVGALARLAPLPLQIKSRVLGKVTYLRRCAAEKAPASSELPDCFMLECYNPKPETVNLTLTIRARQRESSEVFQRVISLPAGFVREQVPLMDISREVNLFKPFEVEIVPNEADNTEIVFGIMDFVWLNKASVPTTACHSKVRTWKCIVWDLDNTLWDGTLIEDGPDKVQLRQAVIEVIKETDRRGILHSVASKNNYDDAITILQKWGLEEYFLHPQISWSPKSQAVARIAELLNIGIDSLAFVDDQPFERAEVKTALPQVCVVDAVEFSSILTREECQVPITEESRQRRVMYRQEQERKLVKESFQGDYRKFLQECRMELVVDQLSEENLERVYELAQRTNQMNFSGSRYPRAQLGEIRRSEIHDTYVMRCSDRFGSYGIVGFAVVDNQEPRLLDLMFSCRIQGKRVEHAFLSYLLDKYSRNDPRDFFANYRKTKKNENAGKVFEEIGFEAVQEHEGRLSLKFSKDRPIPQEGIVHILEKSREGDL